MNHYLAIISAGEYSDTEIYIVGVFGTLEEGLLRAQELADKLNNLAKAAEKALGDSLYETAEELWEAYGNVLSSDPEDYRERADWAPSATKINPGCLYKIF